MSVVVTEGERERPSPPFATPARGGDRRPAHATVAVLACLAAAAVGYVVVATAVLPGPVTGLLVCVLGLTLPTSESLSRRIALFGTVLLGWTPALWWFRWPVEVNHGALVTGLVVGLLAGWLTFDPTARRRVLPRWQIVDVLPPLAGLIGAGLMARWLSAGTPREALNLLLRGYDNVAHFSMFEMERRTGVMADQLGSASDGTAWRYAPYPQGFHSVAATVADVIGAPGRAGGVASLPAYTMSVGAVVVLSTVVLAAALCSLPPFRRRPLVAGPVVAVVVGAFLLGPGGSTITGGFPPFWYACALAAIGLLLSLSWVRPGMPLQLAAVGGAMAGVAQSWAPMCLLLAPAFLCGLLPLRRARWRASTSTWLLSVAIAASVVVAVARPALMLLGSVGIDEVVAASGGFLPPEATRLLVLTLVAVPGACVFPLLQGRAPGGSKPVLRRASLLGLVVAVALLSTGWLVVAQVSRNGRPAYYFFKYLVGVELVVVTLVAVGVGLLLAGRPCSGRRGVWQLLAGLVVLVVPVLVAPSPDRWALVSPDRSATVAFNADLSRPALAQTLLEASSDWPRTPGRAVLLALPPGTTIEASFANAWVLALTGTWTVGADQVAAPLVTIVLDVPTGARVARRVLTRGVRTTVLVPPADLAEVRSRLADPALAARVRTWGVGRG